MTQANATSSEEQTPTLEELVAEISRFEAIIAEWDESQRCVVAGLKRAIEELHKEALTRLIRSVKQESMSALRQAVEDEVVYGLLRYHELIKPPTPPLEVRLQLALEEVRPSLQSHSGDVELVAIKLPDTVEVKLVGTCSNCPAATLTLSDGVEQTIKRYCPEITKVIAVNHSPVAISPDASVLRERLEKWVEVATANHIPEGLILPVELEGTSLILWRSGDEIKCYHNSCTHLAYPLDMGKVNDGIITCPFHRFQYRLETGECLTVPELPLEAYPVKIEENRLFVRLSH